MPLISPAAYTIQPNVLLHAEGTLTEAIGDASVLVIGGGSVNGVQAKFGTTSFFNPGTDTGGTNYLNLSGVGDNLFVAPGQFNIEGWFYIDSFGTDTFTLLWASPGTFPTANQFFCQINKNNGDVIAYNGATKLCESFSAIGAGIPANGLGVWTHIAVSRDATDRCRMWVHGVQGATTNIIAGQVGIDDGGGNSQLRVMGGPIASDNRDVDGFLEEFRWFNGHAIYKGAGSISVPNGPFLP